MKQLGIWLDSNKAVIIHPTSGILNRIESEVEHYHEKGGSRSKIPYGPVDAISPSKLAERKKHQLKAYFDNISNELGEFDELVVFGPAEAKIEFQKYLQSHRMGDKLVGVENAHNRYSDNQLSEWVREYFK